MKEITSTPLINGRKFGKRVSPKLFFNSTYSMKLFRYIHNSWYLDDTDIYSYHQYIILMCK